MLDVIPSWRAAIQRQREALHTVDNYTKAGLSVPAELIAELAGLSVEVGKLAADVQRSSGSRGSDD